MPCVPPAEADQEPTVAGFHAVPAALPYLLHMLFPEKEAGCMDGTGLLLSVPSRSRQSWIRKSSGKIVCSGLMQHPALPSQRVQLGCSSPLCCSTRAVLLCWSSCVQGHPGNRRLSSFAPHLLPQVHRGILSTELLSCASASVCFWFIRKP